jgi:short-subunit dehydrogenase
VSSFPYEGEFAVITGGSRGIGRAMALHLASCGMDLLLIARRRPPLRDVEKEIQKTFPERRVIPLSLDLRNPGQVERKVKEVCEKEGLFTKVSVLVHNAGIFSVGSFLKSSFEEWRSAVALHLLSPVCLTQIFLPFMIRRRKGAILFLSSLAGKIPFPEETIYCTTKFALTGFSASLREEVRKYGVRVITLFPGLVDTEMVQGVSFLEGRKKILPEDLAKLAISALTLSSSLLVEEIVVTPP